MDYIILLFSCIAEYLIFSDFFDAFLSIRPNFQPIWNRILIAIPFIGIYFGINTLQISYLNMISFICLLLLYSFLYEANLKERLLYIVFLCAIFFVEDLSVMIQVAYFKITKRKYGEGRRVFKMTPLHHHFQKPGNAGINALIQKPLQAVPESKIVVRFWIVCIMLAAITIVTLKMR